MTSADPHHAIKNWGFVIAQFALIGACFIGALTDPPTERGLLRVVLSAALLTGGGGLGIWALWSMGSNTFSVTPQPVPTGDLCERGPYHWVCHPMYTAVLLVCLSAWVQSPTLFLSAAWALLLAVLVGKLSFEERLLTAQFSEYESYKRNRHRLVPYVW